MDSTQDAYQIKVNDGLITVENHNIQLMKQTLTSPHSCSKLNKKAETLLEALELDNRELAIQLLQVNISLDITNDEDSTCLMIAAKRNNLDSLNRMLELNQIDVNATDYYGWTALMYASYYGHAEVARALLLQGAQVDIYDNDQMSCLIWAAGRGFLDCVTVLLQLGRAKVDQVDKCGTTPLIWACRRGYTEVASVLLKANANIDSIGMFGWSSLLVAVHGNHMETLKLLLQHKPNVNTCDSQHHTPLIAASKEGKVEIVRMLLKARAFVNLSDEYGHTALIHATRGSHLEVIDLLLKHHANIDHAGIDDKTALFWAVEKGNLKIVERLLQSKPNLEATTRDGETCLMRAVRLRRVGVVRILLNQQAKASAIDRNGDTVLHMAVKLQSATMAQLILSNTKNHHLLNKCNKNKKTPIMLDNENSSQVFPTLLEIHQSGSKISYKVTNSNLLISDLNRFEEFQSETELNLNIENQSSSPLVKKLAFAMNRNHPTNHHQQQTQPRVLA